MPIKNLLLIFLAGGIGTLSRFGLNTLVQSVSTLKFPLGTLTVNITGSFFFGIIWALLSKDILPESSRVIILTGFFGAFTTFSSFIFDSYDLSRSSIELAISNILIQNVMGIIFLCMGIKVIRGELF